MHRIWIILLLGATLTGTAQGQVDTDALRKRPHHRATSVSRMSNDQQGISNSQMRLTSRNPRALGVGDSLLAVGYSVPTTEAEVA